MKQEDIVMALPYINLVKQLKIWEIDHIYEKLEKHIVKKFKNQKGEKLSG